MGITAGPDGAVWFTETGSDRIGRITSGGTYAFFALPAQTQSTLGTGNEFYITTGSDGALWFTRVNTFGSQPTIDRITTAGTVTETPLTMLNDYGLTSGPDGAIWVAGFEGVPEDIDVARVPTNGGAISYFPDSTGGDGNTTIATGSDGALWYTNSNPDVVSKNSYSVDRVTTSGAQSAYPSGTTIPVAITAGPDRALWFTGYTSTSLSYANVIDQISTSGVITGYPLPTEVTSSGLANPNGVVGTDDGIVAGPDGALWFTDPESNSIGRITTAGALTRYPIPSAKSFPQQIAVGPDGALWFTENQTDAIGRITTSGSVTEFRLLCATATANARARRPAGASAR